MGRRGSGGYVGRQALPDWGIKPDIEDLISVSFQRYRGTPLEVPTNATWLKAISDPGTGDLSGIGRPHPLDSGGEVGGEGAKGRVGKRVGVEIW